MTAGQGVRELAGGVLYTGHVLDSDELEVGPLWVKMGCTDS